MFWLLLLFGFRPPSFRSQKANRSTNQVEPTTKKSDKNEHINNNNNNNLILTERQKFRRRERVKRVSRTDQKDNEIERERKCIEKLKKNEHNLGHPWL